MDYVKTKRFSVEPRLCRGKKRIVEKCVRKMIMEKCVRKYVLGEAILTYSATYLLFVERHHQQRHYGGSLSQIGSKK